MIKLKPTLFIGIGTSGLAIINAVRELFYEEFLTAGFPCVRFLHISSHTGGEKYNLPSDLFPNDFEKIKIAEVSIKSQQYNQVRYKLDPNHQLYQEGLKEWLPNQLANLGNVSLELGMKNNRKLGRLALWLNWTELVDSLQTHMQIVQQPENHAKTDQMLKDYHSRKNILPDGVINFLEEGVNVFIAGTLLGGTGSGGFLDLAFYLRETYPGVQIKGIFTILDSSLAGQPNNAQLAANAYAAMVELDYYTQDGTEYNYLLPDTSIRKQIINPPFNHVSIITTKNIKGNNTVLARPDGTIDHESLHKMIGMTLFFDIVAGAGNSLESLRTNWDGSLFVRLDRPPRYLRRFSSFGAVAFWYPKSRIADIAASKYIKSKLAVNWLGTEKNSNPSLIEESANDFVKQLSDTIRRKLSALTEGGIQNTLQASWLPIYTNLRERLSAEKINIDEVRSLLYTEPDSNPLATRFKLNGYYYKKLDLNLIPAMKSVESDIAKRIENLITESISSVFSNSHRFSLIDLQKFSEKVMELISNIINESPNISSRDIDFEVLEPNFIALKEEQSRILTALVGARPDVIRQHANRIADSIHYLISDAENLLLSHFLARFYQDNQSSIRGQIYTKINRIYDIVDDIKRTAEDKIRSLSEIKDYSSLKIILRKPTIEEETDDISKIVTDSTVSSHLSLKTIPLMLEARNESPVIFNDLLHLLQVQILQSETIANFSIMTEKHLNYATLLSYAPNAEPMFEPTKDRPKIPYRTNQHPTLIAGGDQQSRTAARERINSGPGQEMKITFELDVNLNHLLYLYKEEAAIAINEFEAFRHMHVQYKNGKLGNGPHIDQDPSKFDIERFLTMEEMKKEDWFRLICDFFAKEIFEEVTILNDGCHRRFKLTFVDSNQITGNEYFYSDKSEDFYNKLSSDTDVFETIKRKLTEIFNSLNRASFTQMVNSYKETLVKGGMEPSSEEYNAISDFYKEIINSKYPIV
jgi:hypothetical protein